MNICIDSPRGNQVDGVRVNAVFASQCHLLGAVGKLGLDRYDIRLLQFASEVAGRVGGSFGPHIISLFHPRCALGEWRGVEQGNAVGSVLIHPGLLSCEQISYVCNILQNTKAERGFAGLVPRGLESQRGVLARSKGHAMPRPSLGDIFGAADVGSPAGNVDDGVDSGPVKTTTGVVSVELQRTPARHRADDTLVPAQPRRLPMNERAAHLAGIGRIVLFPGAIGYIEAWRWVRRWYA